MKPQASPVSDVSLVRSLGLKEAAALVIGTVVGTGVFIQAAGMTQQAGSATWVLLAWVTGGVLSLCGALCYAELSGLFPSAGGEYVFLREAYGGGVAFLFGWMRFWVVSPGSIAAYSVGAATFLSGPLGLGQQWQRSLFAAAAIIAFSGLNCLSVAVGGRVQKYLTTFKVVMIVGLTASIFLLGHGSTSNLTTSLTSTGGLFPGWNPFGAALIAALFAYDGWNNTPMAAGEIIDPGRNLPRALGLGMAGVLAIYALVNLAYFYALPADLVAASYSSAHVDALPVATLAAKNSFGPGVIPFFSFLFAISAFGALNGSVLTNARVPFAMARDKLFFRSLARLNAKTHVPVTSILWQAVVSILLAISGTFDQITVAVVFASWIFYGLGAFSVFILRRKLPLAKREFRIPFYPWLPLVFFVAALLILASALMTSPRESGLGVAFTLAGIPVYFWFRSRAAKEAGRG